MPRTSRRFQAAGIALCCVATIVATIGSRSSAGAAVRPVATPTPAPEAAVINVTLIPASRAAEILRPLFPRDRIRVDTRANALVVFGPPDDIQQMRGVVQGIDVRSPQRPANEIIALRFLHPADIALKLKPLFPNARIQPISKTSVLVRATPQDMSDIKALISSLDNVPPTTLPTTPPEEALRITYAKPRNVALALERQLPHLRASVSGNSVILVGSDDDIQRAKSIAQTIDAPAPSSKYTQVYRLQAVDATSVGDLITRSYPDAKVTVDKDLNALSVLATSAQQQRISAALTLLDQQPSPTSGASGTAAYGGGNSLVIDLESAVPGINGPSTSAQDIANAVQQALQSVAPDLHITPLANSSTLILTGNPNSIRLAKELITRLDRRQPLVVLDTEVLEVSENAARDVGLEFPVATIQSSFQEVQPTPNPFTGQPGRLIGLQPVTRTGLQLTATLNFLIQSGNARVLSDPRITTISGHTASIRAGDTINILTQTGGGIGTPITQQLQTFNTGVTLDITPIVGPSGDVTVALHPVVNSLEGLLNGLPQIATRDTQTLVQLHDNDTLIIGGLIQESQSRQISKLPLLGDIPLIGKLFQNSNVQNQRNELVIVVTPHVIQPGQPLPPPQATMALPTAAPLPTLPPGARLPNTKPSEVPRTVPIPVNVPTPTQEPSPQPTPSAFTNTNVFVYGTAPANTYAPDTSPPQIFFAQLSPTLLHAGTSVQVSAVTTSNVKKVVLAYGSYSTTLGSIAQSRWQAIFSFNAAGFSPNSTVQMTLTAYNSLGGASSIQIPVAVAP